MSFLLPSILPRSFSLSVWRVVLFHFFKRVVFYRFVVARRVVFGVWYYVIINQGMERMVVEMYFHHDILDKMTNMVKTYITDYLHDDVAAYDVQRIVSIL